MRRIPRSTRNQNSSVGTDKSTILLILLPMVLLEFMLGVFLIVYGFRTISLWVPILFVWNAGLILGFITYIVTHKKRQANGYIEVSNYANLNKVGRDKF